MRCSLIHQTFSSIIFPFVPLLYQLNLHNILCLVFTFNTRLMSVYEIASSPCGGALGCQRVWLQMMKWGEPGPVCHQLGVVINIITSITIILFIIINTIVKVVEQGRFDQEISSLSSKVIWCFLRSERHCKADKDSHRLINICAFFLRPNNRYRPANPYMDPIKASIGPISGLMDSINCLIHHQQ